MMTTLTTPQATAIHTAEREATRAVASLREWRQSGQVFPRQVRGVMERLEACAERLDKLLDELEA